MSDADRTRQDFAPRIMIVATAVAIAGAFLTYPIEPWGPQLAVGLMFGWAALALFLAFRQKAREEAAATPSAARPPSHPVVRIFWALMMIAGVGAFAYGHLLKQQGQPRDVVQVWRDSAAAFMFLGLVGTMALDWVIERLQRRRGA